MPGERIKLNFTLNDEQVILECPASKKLIDIIRMDFGLLETRSACGKGECGSCLVLMNGSLVNSCLVPAFTLSDAELLTVEGIEKSKKYTNIQRIFSTNLFYCDFCSSGVKMAIAALLMHNPQPTKPEIREALSGNFCRCSNYLKIEKIVIELSRQHGKRLHAKATARKPESRKPAAKMNAGAKSILSSDISPCSRIKVFRPKSLSGLLRLYEKNPDALIFAGGTEIVPAANMGSNMFLNLPPQVIYIGNVGELKRISRSQRYLDIGSCNTLSRILSIGRHIIPQVLFDALLSVGNPAVRNLATLGGNICSTRLLNNLMCALNVIDTRMELRKASGSRWLRISQCFSDPFFLKKGEILSRVRVPLENWSDQIFRIVSRGHSHQAALLAFSGVVRLNKGVVESLHFSLGGPGMQLFRSRDLEAKIEGSTLPIPEKEIESLVQDFSDRIGSFLSDNTLDRYRKSTAQRLVRWYINRLNQKNL